MLIEIPEFKRACFCVPLRYGIIIIGYLNLGISICHGGIEMLLGVHRGVPLPGPLWFVLLLYFAEIIFSVVLLIGAHRKMCTLLNAFYYYSLSTTLAAFASLIMLFVLYHREYIEHEGYVELSFAFTCFAIHTYLLLLIRSEVKKLRNCNPYIVVNHMTDVVIEQPMEEGRTISVD